MSRYSLLVTLHVASVIAWLGASTTLVFVTIYARRAASDVVLGQLGVLTRWLSLWVIAPFSLATVGLGLEAARTGHWPQLLFFHVGEGAFAFSFLLTAAVRLPLIRRATRGEVDVARLWQYLLALAIADLTVLYVAVADMVFKPTDAGSSVVRWGAVVLALGFLSAAAVAYRARRLDPPGGAGRLTGVGGRRVGGFEHRPLPESNPSGQILQRADSRRTP
jgi:hypothetical protein